MDKHKSNIMIFAETWCYSLPAMKQTNFSIAILIFFSFHQAAVHAANTKSHAHYFFENKDSLSSDSVNVMAYYAANHDTLLPSKSLGTVSDGELVNGRIIPFYGKNFQYFFHIVFFTCQIIVK